MLCILLMLTAVSCDFGGDDDAVETTASDTAADGGDTTAADHTETTAPDSETTAPADNTTDPAVSKAEAAAFLDKLIAADTESNSTNYRGTIDLTFDIKAGVGGMTTTQTMPIKMDSIVDGDKFQAVMNMMGVEYNVIYVDGIVYVDAMDEKVFMTASPEQAGDITDMLFGSGDDSDDATGGMDFEMPDGVKSADMFQTITLEKKADGSAVVTVKGISPELADELAPSFMSFLLSMNLIGYDMEEYDEDALIKETIAIIKTLGEDKFAFSMTTDTKGALNGISLDITLASSFESDGQKIDTSVGIKGNITYTEGGQTVKVPADVSEYAETNWEDFFGGEGDLGDPESLGLVPGADGKIALSNNSEIRAAQLTYIVTYAEEFEGLPFKMDGYIYFESRDESGMIFLLDDEGNMDFMSYMDAFLSDDSLFNKITDQGEEPTVLYKTEGYFTLAEIDNEPFVVYIINSIA